MSKYRPRTAAEVMAELEADPDWVARQRAAEQERNDLRERLRLEEQPLLVDLGKVGLHIQSVWELVNTSRPYPEAVPVLLQHLSRGYSEKTKEGIARALAVPSARYAWSILADFYRREPENETSKQGLAVAVSVTASDAVLEDLIALAMDPANGGTRVLLLRAIRKSKRESARKALEVLAADPQLEKEIASWRPRKRP